jgi:hypothetical protein
MPYNFTLNLSTEKYTIEIDPAANYGYFERKTGGEGGLWFEKIPAIHNHKETRLSLIDYDGVYELPNDVLFALQNAAIHVDRDFFPENMGTKNTPMTFERWMQAVDAEIERRTGFTSDDLPDVSYWDWWDSGLTPIAAAGRVLRNAGGA